MMQRSAASEAVSAHAAFRLVVLLILGLSATGASCAVLKPKGRDRLPLASAAAALDVEGDIHRRAAAEAAPAGFADGAHHVEAVFERRFQPMLSNLTLLHEFDTSLGLLLDAPRHYATLLRNAPEVHERRAQQVIVAALDLVKQQPTGTDSLAHSLFELSRLVGLLGVESCHPVTRRVVLAALIRLRLRSLSPGIRHTSETAPVHPSRRRRRSTLAAATAGQAAAAARAVSGRPAAAAAAAVPADEPSAWGGQVPSLVFKICKQLYTRHRQGIAYKGAIEFLHVSKSGGTSMCEVAERNGCAAQSTTKFGNCMVRAFDDKPRWVSAAVHNETVPVDEWKFVYRYLVRRGDRNCTYRWAGLGWVHALRCAVVLVACRQLRRAGSCGVPGIGAGRAGGWVGLGDSGQTAQWEHHNPYAGPHPATTGPVCAATSWRGSVCACVCVGGGEGFGTSHFVVCMRREGLAACARRLCGWHLTHLRVQQGPACPERNRRQAAPAHRCTRRDEFMRRKGYTFYSNEHAVHGGLEDFTTARLCSAEFVNVVMLRDPLARLKSHVRWIIKVRRGAGPPRPHSCTRAVAVMAGCCAEF